MTEDILKEIKKKAEEIYPVEFTGAGLTDGSHRLYRDAQERNIKAYTSGCIDQHEFDMKFMEWASFEGWSYDKHFEIWNNNFRKSYTTEQLLSLYIKQLNNG